MKSIARRKPPKSTVITWLIGNGSPSTVSSFLTARTAPRSPKFAYASLIFTELPTFGIETSRSRGIEVIAITSLSGSSRTRMIVSERGGMPASLSPKRRSEPRIISVCALPASARSISGISIAARPSSRRMSMIVVDLQQHGRRDRARGHQADQHAGEQATPEQSPADPGRRLVAVPAGEAARYAHASPPSTARSPSGRSSACGSPATKSHSVWR